MKVVSRGNHLYAQLFIEDGKRWLKISDLIARSFLGVNSYAFLDGDSTNVHLENIAPISAAMEFDEIPIEGFDNFYTINIDGDFHSYKRGKRAKLKTCNSLGKSKRVCLTDTAGNQHTLYVNDLIQKYLKLH